MMVEIVFALYRRLLGKIEFWLIFGRNVELGHQRRALSGWSTTITCTPTGDDDGSIR